MHWSLEMLQCSSHPVFVLSCLQVNYKDLYVAKHSWFCMFLHWFVSDYFTPRPLSSIFHSGARAMATPECWSPKPWLENDTVSLHLSKQQLHRQLQVLHKQQHVTPSKEGHDAPPPGFSFHSSVETLLMCGGKKNHLQISHIKLCFLLWAKLLVEIS